MKEPDWFLRPLFVKKRLPPRSLSAESLPAALPPPAATKRLRRPPLPRRPRLKSPFHP